MNQGTFTNGHMTFRKYWMDLQEFESIRTESSTSTASSFLKNLLALYSIDSNMAFIVLCNP